VIAACCSLAASWKGTSHYDNQSTVKILLRCTQLHSMLTVTAIACSQAAMPEQLYNTREDRRRAMTGTHCSSCVMAQPSASGTHYTSALLLFC
jgi:hypothetical protein